MAKERPNLVEASPELEVGSVTYFKTFVGESVGCNYRENFPVDRPGWWKNG